MCTCVCTSAPTGTLSVKLGAAGTAFVKYTDAVAAARAVQHKSGTTINDHPITVSLQNQPAGAGPVPALKPDGMA